MGIMDFIRDFDSHIDGLDLPAKAATLLGTAGWASTQNTVWLLGVLGGAGMLAIQMWWEFYRQKRRFWLENEIWKARKRKELSAEGLDVVALKESPDPDSTEI